VDHVIDEIEGVDHVIDEIEGKASELVPIDREKIKRWVILHHPTLEWSSLSDSTLSSVIDFAIDKIEEGPVEVAEVSKRNGHELWPALAEPLQVGYLASVGDRVTLARIYDSAPHSHVGDLTKRLVRRILFASCTVSSGECAIRQECINKCVTFDANPDGTSR
jgi:hypothetical protein